MLRAGQPVSIAASGWTSLNLYQWQAGFGFAVVAAAAVLVALAALDLRHFWLPDRLILILLLIAVASWWMDIAPSAFDRFLGAAGGYAALTIVAAAYRLVRKRDGLGAGDAKLFGALGAILGWQALPLVLVGACSVGLFFVAARVIGGQEVVATDRLPLGALLAFAAFPAWIIQQ